MDADIKTWLYDINNAIEEIKAFMNSISNDFTLYQKDVKTRRAVERNLGIIGEAMNRIIKRNASIPLSDIRLIIATRNKIIHGYESVSDRVIWTIVFDDLPVLKKEIDLLLGDDSLLFNEENP